MKRSRCYLIAVLMLLGGGAVRLPLEAGLTRELRQAELLVEPLELATRERIGQTSSAVALGGLRTLVATFVHLRAFTAFSERRWADVESSFGTVVDLAPRTPYYWRAGTWHMAYDAASYYRHVSELPALRRNAASRAYILKGRAFLERGIRNNPDDPGLREFLGHLLSNPDKVGAFGDEGAAFSDAADAYAEAAATGRALPYVRRAQLFALARAPGREAEALELARRINEEEDGGPPMFLAVWFALEMRESPEGNALELALELFGSAENAHEVLASYWGRSRDRFPMNGVAAALGALEVRLLIPPDESALRDR